MLVFEYILILLVAIFISNLINRFLPSVSVPIIQILLGALIALIPLNFKLELEPSLFFILFIAPLVFNSSMLMDKQSFWALKVPIMNLAFLLVFATVIGIGYLTHLLIPTIPLVAVFVLMAALAPTDDIAVFSVAKRVNVPPRIMNILSGESIINDASGIVCFQFAVAAVVTGTFSVTDAIGRFIILGLGGILVGLAFTLLKYALVRWIRSLGMENVTLHILIEILTPFLVYLIAETLEVSGILAIFSAGIAHSVGRKKLNPENASLNIASDSIWNVFSFTLEGLVFLILGTQLPDILRTVQSGSYPVETWEIVLYVLLITLIFALSRFVWSYCSIRKKVYHDPDHPISKFRACMIFSLSGARGAVTLASVLSIPILLNDGSAFPQRDM
ncbi:MAG: sodium:proton antiporter, partial [Bacteroidales bacterium]|nr:sodium:proton antiporter [Bacteroidales bacterium]